MAHRLTDSIFLINKIPEIPEQAGLQEFQRLKAVFIKPSTCFNHVSRLHIKQLSQSVLGDGAQRMKAKLGDYFELPQERIPESLASIFISSKCYLSYLWVPVNPNNTKKWETLFLFLCSWRWKNVGEKSETVLWKDIHLNQLLIAEIMQRGHRERNREHFRAFVR